MIDWPQSPRDVADTIWNVFLADKERGRGADRARTLLSNFCENWPEDWCDSVRTILRIRREDYDEKEARESKRRRQNGR